MTSSNEAGEHGGNDRGAHHAHRAHRAPDAVESALPDFAPKPRNQPMLGAALMATAAILFTCLNGVVRHVSDLGVPSLQIAFLRSIFALAVMLPIVAPTVFREGWRWLATVKPGLHLVRGLAATTGVIGWITALATLPLSEATAITFTAPLFATIGSALILGEVVRLRRWSAVLIGFVGVIVIVRPGMVPVEGGALWALMGAAGMACAVLSVKALTRTEPTQRIVLYNSVLLTLFTAVPAALVWQPIGWDIWLLGLAMGGIAAVSQMFLSKAFECADASIIAPFDYSRLPFAALLGWVAFGQVTDWITWAGAALIAGAAFYTARREQMVARAAREASLKADKER
ncbi:DMT family transporter [Marivibrio halodurans]|uniref:DMT family transporter n=1 Tax=Marivibrio halodurans TaxID=2039722 RepID=A0A8J7S2F9_9PROT|nr:DMT family transporter [Marivibrio halodurans]